jgi:hypothetical protein
MKKDLTLTIMNEIISKILIVDQQCAKILIGEIIKNPKFAFLKNSELSVYNDPYNTHAGTVTKNKNIMIAIAGKRFSGKSTMAKFLRTHYDFVEFSFARPLKRVCAIIFGLTREELEIPLKKEIGLDRFGGLSPREIVLGVGDVLRNRFKKLLPNQPLKYKSIFTDIMAVNILVSGKKVVISDYRYPDEKELLDDFNFTTILVKRDALNVSIGDDTIDFKDSETTDVKFDYVIRNNGTIGEFNGKIKKLLRSLNGLSKSTSVVKKPILTKKVALSNCE